MKEEYIRAFALKRVRREEGKGLRRRLRKKHIVIIMATLLIFALVAGAVIIYTLPIEWDAGACAGGNGISVIVASTFNDLNCNDIEYVTALAKELGARQITYSATLNVGRAKVNNLVGKLKVKELMLKGMELKQKYTDNTFYVHAQDVTEDGLKKKATTCGRGNTQICIRENGNVSPCIQFNFVYGNLKSQDIYDIFNYKRVLPMIDFKEPDMETCSDCSEIYNCGGCVALAYDMPTEVCKWKRENPAVIEQFNKVALRM